MKNKILIFFSANVYPKGGMKDLIGEADSLEEAERYGLVCWWQLVNKENLQIIKCSEDE
jgi:hypothetical protein